MHFGIKKEPGNPIQRVQTTRLFQHVAKIAFRHFMGCTIDVEELAQLNNPVTTQPRMGGRPHNVTETGQTGA